MTEDFWLVTGPIEHWRYGLENGIWGATEEIRDRWGEKGPKKDDIFFFYASAPIKRIIGYAVLEDIVHKSPKKRIWKRELESRIINYKYTTIFSNLRSVIKPTDSSLSWKEKGIEIEKTCRGNLNRAFTRVLNEDCQKELIKCKEIIDERPAFTLKEPNWGLIKEISKGGK